MSKLKLDIDKLTVNEADKIVISHSKFIDGLQKDVSKELFEKVFTECGGEIEEKKGKIKYFQPDGFYYDWTKLYDILLGVTQNDIFKMKMVLEVRKSLEVRENEKNMVQSEKLYQMYGRWNWISNILNVNDYGISIFKKSNKWYEEFKEIQNYVNEYVKTQKNFRIIDSNELNKLRSELQPKIQIERKKKERKIFNEIRKKKELEVKLKTIERYGGEIYQMYINKEISLQEAFNHSKSEQLGIEGYKSRGTKGFINSTKVKSTQSDSKALPYNKHPLTKSDKFNTTFDEINRMDYTVFKGFTLELRNELYRVWKELNTPPYIGKSREGIIDDLTKLKTEKTSKLKKKGDDYFEYIISNDWRYGSSCNQFQPGLHKTRIDGISLWDILENDDYLLKWIRLFTRNLKQDYSYEFSSRLKFKSDIRKIDLTTYGILIQRKDKDDELTFSKSEINKLKKEGIIKEFHIYNLGIDWDNYKRFEIRTYKKTEKIFSHIIHIIRVGINNTPVNFSPFVARFIYEKYLPKNKESVVYDSSTGWGGRLLGSIMSDRDIRYIGCDVNSNLFLPVNTYESMGEFIQRNFDIKPNFSIKKISSTNFDKTEEYKKYKGKCDMILTSPPYYIREEYSTDSEQSYLMYNKYEDWLNVYIKKTFQIGYDMVKKGGLCFLNISDVNVKSQKFELELDVLNILEEIGWKYRYDIGMTMKRFIGLKTEKIVNRYFDEDKESYSKVEPILVFEK